MKQTCFIITLLTVLPIGVIISINSGIAFVQEEKDTLKIDDSGLITTTKIDKSMEINITLAQIDE
jgi:hypothetical protein